MESRILGSGGKTAMQKKSPMELNSATLAQRKPTPFDVSHLPFGATCMHPSMLVSLLHLLSYYFVFSEASSHATYVKKYP